jgi:hypothetical protein
MQLNQIRPYRFADSAITIIQGVIQQENPQEWRQDFLSWVNEVKAIQSKIQGVDNDK